MCCFFNGLRVNGSPVCRRVGKYCVPMMYPDFTNIIMHITICEECLEEWKYHITENTHFSLDTLPIYELPSIGLLERARKVILDLIPEEEVRYTILYLLADIEDYLNVEN